MAKTTVDAMLEGVRKDALADQEYKSLKRRIQRAMSEALFRLRKGANLTQTALGERAGWQQSYVARIERGEAQMITALEGLEAFANAAEASAVVLFVDHATGQVRAQVPLGEAPMKVSIEDKAAREAIGVERRMTDFAVADVAFDVKAVKVHQDQVFLEIQRITKTMNQDMKLRIAELLELTERARAESPPFEVSTWQAVPAGKR